MPLHKFAPDLKTFVAHDGCTIAEVIHPANDGTDPQVSLARAVLSPKQATNPHILDFTEIYYIISGTGLIHLNGRSSRLGPEDCVYIPAATEQWVENTGEADLVFLCVCSPAYDPKRDHPAHK